MVIVKYSEGKIMKVVKDKDKEEINEELEKKENLDKEASENIPNWVK